jgi:F-type H+-transporting ATPase subunit delta
MISRTVSRRYAKSLMAVALERGIDPESVLGELENAAAFVAEQPRIIELYTNPKIPMSQRLGALERFLAASQLQPLNQNFLRLLVRKQRIAILPGVVEEFRAMADAQAGVIRGAVTSATPLPEAVVEFIRTRLANRFGKKVILSLAVDPELIGGLVVRVGSLSYDGSLRSQLKAMQSQLLEGVPLS